ncbi:unnamed protein product [Rangifer tarandus platyrhynchus]|uniref:Uncharacterized protein n=2 Tax=Rangifer tarandus platyrhynchus TaxID=3082113 RepID=A0ACB0ENJ4_RANTA|nr:unnamed protein product [Rangifer tarandus platyrhynchus]CAI9701994.1 unnamed protein product [Rangifer tarandus platyrhynchus]
MVDFAMDVYKNLYSDDIPHALREKRTTVVVQLKQLPEETESIVKMFEDPETTRQMQSTRDGRMLFDYLADKHGFRQEYLDIQYRKKLRECESVLVNDFFLVACLEDFIENAHLFIFETFCYIDQCISINMLVEKQNMAPEEAERWIVNLIRNARLDAKIDSKLGHVVMGNNAVSPYQQMIKKTKSLSFRSQILAMNIEKKLNQNSRSEAPNWAAQDSGFYGRTVQEN